MNRSSGHPKKKSRSRGKKNTSGKQQLQSQHHPNDTSDVLDTDDIPLPYSSASGLDSSEVSLEPTSACCEHCGQCGGGNDNETRKSHKCHNNTPHSHLPGQCVTPDQELANRLHISEIAHNRTTKKSNRNRHSKHKNLISLSGITISDNTLNSCNETLSESTLTVPRFRNNDEKFSDDNILQLPDDVLYIILSYLRQYDVCQLSLVCTSFYHICGNDSVWSRHIKGLILYSGFPSRRQCTNKELCRLTRNWEKGRFHQSFMAKQNTKLIPWLQKDNDVVWFSVGNVIRHFHYHSLHGWKEDKKRSLRGMPKDASRFSSKRGVLASGCRDGSIHLWKTTQDRSHIVCQEATKNEILCIDLSERAVVSGAKDGACTVTVIRSNDSNLEDSVFNKDCGFRKTTRTFAAGEKVWSLRVSPCERFFVAGLAGLLNSSPLVMWDIESGHHRGSLGSQHRHGAGILDIKFESHHELLTCGYDTILRLWDLRTERCVASWEEPYDYTLFSLATDGSNAISVGTSRHGLVRLWDKRCTEPIQCFYSDRCNSPVYSLAMDHRSLLLALDTGFSAMDFSVR